MADTKYERVHPGDLEEGDIILHGGKFIRLVQIDESGHYRFLLLEEDGGFCTTRYSVMGREMVYRERRHGHKHQ